MPTCVQIFMLVEQTPRQEWFAGLVVNVKDRDKAGAKGSSAMCEAQWNKLVGKWQVRCR